MADADWRRRALRMAPERLLHHSTGFRAQLLDQDTPPSLILERYRRTLLHHWATLSDTEKRNIFAFAEWCVRQQVDMVWNAAGVRFYEHLFGDEHDWSEIVPWLSPHVVAVGYPLWLATMTAEETARLRDLLAKPTPPLYAPIYLATQTTECAFPQPPPLPDVTIRLTMELDFSDELFGGLGIGFPHLEELPEEWRWEMWEFLKEAVHTGWGMTDYPLPENGMDFVISHLTITPPVVATTDEATVQRVCMLLYSIVAGIVVSLFSGLTVTQLPPQQEATGYSPSLWERGRQTRADLGQ